eukprot:CAMPEP_0177335180 /NCGR_PEP_ID=MMETSP0368-20130122/23116_1 /TAXON_ID=447022 ORGANISM="Scrippsiella hangoei-like, Strain SHHI-4" /NCGR_SAMPLE_ID=MMETSP0368 /ASSEMBLY_ACC=CAM_ASM_000363 /LENGTH=411 /DNA_ID=CAMNT_0018795951 /DNA_START=17 /DNA_END=1252 /DNA_ORIENTATION=-
MRVADGCSEGAELTPREVPARSPRRAGEEELGPIGLLLQQEERRRRREMTAEQKRRLSVGAAGSRRPNSARGRGGRPSYLDPTSASLVRKGQAAPGRSDTAEAALLIELEALTLAEEACWQRRVLVEDASTRTSDASTSASGADGKSDEGAAGHGASQDSASRKGNWSEFQRRNNAFVEEKEMIMQVLREKKEEAELQECTFRPAITPPPRENLHDATRPRSTASMYDRGLEDQAKRELRLQKIRDERAEKEFEECSFKPQCRSSSRQQPGSTLCTPRGRPQGSRATSTAAVRGTCAGGSSSSRSPAVLAGGGSGSAGGGCGGYGGYGYARRYSAYAVSAAGVPSLRQGGYGHGHGYGAEAGGGPTLAPLGGGDTATSLPLQAWRAAQEAAFHAWDGDGLEEDESARTMAP